MKSRKYELIEHTADLGIRVRGKSIKEIFEKAGLAIFEIMAEKRPKEKKKRATLKIRVAAADREALLVNWLNELLSLSATKGIIFDKLHISQMTEQALDAVAMGSDITGYQMNSEIKAATFHGLKLERHASYWQAEVIFDV